MKVILKNKYIRIGLLVTIGMILGWLIKPTSDKSVSNKNIHVTDTRGNTQVWTCSMHPQIRQNEPGKCPICGMDLIPLTNTTVANEDPMAINMSSVAMRLANVQTSIVSRQNPVKEVSLTGKVQADERKVFSQASHIPGRIEQLMINYTGEQVQQGQTLAMVYSPELVTAQEELFEAIKIKAQNPSLFNAAKEKLTNWKLREKQIDDIIAKGSPQERFPVWADASGVVLKKRVNTGDYVMKGMSIYDVVDLSAVWILFDVYESDMAWVKTGSKIDFTVSSVPGKTFTGTISFIDPVINPQTRVAKARVEYSNPGLKLKPEMFVNGTVKSVLYRKNEDIIIPKTAVMWTGERSVVYVKSNAASGVNFSMREITLGPSLGDSYVVEKGLEEGEEIATNGTFSIDAAAQLAGKPSMMNPDGGPSMTGHNHGGMSTNSNSTNLQSISIGKEVKHVLYPLFIQYLSLKDALVNDDFKKSKEQVALLLQDIDKVEMKNFRGAAHNVWMKHSQNAKDVLHSIDDASNIGEVRQAFKLLSDEFIVLAITFGPFDQVLYIQHCPMANNNKGADWINSSEEIENPYFGNKMLTCGEVLREIK